jgi:hypothetical protein
MSVLSAKTEQKVEETLVESGMLKQDKLDEAKSLSWAFS